MNIIDAYWEKRNLGVDTVEFQIEPDDKKNVLLEIKARESQYNVVKLPSTMPELLFELQSDNYQYVESSIKLELKLEDFVLPEEWSRFVEFSFSKQMGESRIEGCLSEIEKGMFSTDRIYLDPHFGPEQSARRYMNWVKDEFYKGTPIFEFYYGDQPIGFYMVKNIGNQAFDTTLGGVYTQWLGSPLAVNFLYEAAKEGARLGFRKIVTQPSSNNLKSLKLHTMMGFEIVKIDYVLVKHK